MKHFRILSLALIGSLALLTASCVKEIVSNEEMYRPKGSPIVFSASAGYGNGIETRAEYSGVLFTGLYGTSQSYERLDWQESDPISISYNGHNSGTPVSYTVTSSITADGKNSNATLSGTTLEWSGSGNHIFYALYPNRTGAGSLSSSGVVSGTIPTAQDVTSKRLLVPVTVNGTSYNINKYQPDTEHYGYLVAYEQITSTSDAYSVDLHFKPAVTTFEFRLKRSASTDPNPVLKSAKLETEAVSGTTTPLAGGFSFKILGRDETEGGNNLGARWNKALTGTDHTTLNSTSNMITVSFGNDGVQIPHDNFLDFSILALPIDITGLKLTLEFEDGDKVLYFKNKTSGVWATFDGAKKYVITNVAPTDDWDYYIEEIPDITTYGHDAASQTFNVWSYRVNRLDNSIKQAVKWKVQYYDNGDSEWYDLPTNAGVVNSTLNATFDINSRTGNGAVYQTDPAEVRTASVSGTTPADSSGEEGGNDPGTAARAKLASASPRGTSANPFDLSRHPFYGSNIDGTAGNINSANCYIVSAPGYYMFPCVYGNSIMNGDINVSSYSPSTATDAVSATGLSQLKDVNTTYNTTSYPSHYYLPTFRNAWNNAISSPYIWTDCSISSGDESAIVVWQDTAVGDEIIPYDASQITNPTALGTTTKTVTINGSSKSCMYIWFKIDPENIKPGNIMIALRDESRIVWSWHIWVTEKDLEPKAVDTYTLTLDDNSTTTFTIMPFNLGWLDSAAGSVTKYKDRPISYRVVQIDGSNAIIPEGYKANGVDYGEPFDFIQIGDAKTITPTVGGNPYYQWGRKDPLIPSTEGGGNRPFSQNPKLTDHTGNLLNISPTQGIHIPPSNSVDYGTAIQHPYYYYSNNLTTGYVGGTAYPFWSGTGYRLTKDDRGNPYFRFQLDYYINLGLTNEASVEFVDLNGQTNQTDMWAIWRIKTNGYYNVGPYTAAQVRQFVDWQFNAGHFADADFTNDNWAYTPAQKEAAVASMYNLWNAFIYSDQPARGTFGGTLPTATNAAAYHRNKFKTIYDPCPAGFVVPTKASYLGNSNITYREVAHATGGPNNGPYTERWKGGAPFSGASISPSSAPVAGVGITVSGQLFPFTGARVCYNDGAGNVVLNPEGQGERGFYWTDNPLNIEPVYSGASDYYSINSYYFFQHSYIFMFGYENGSMTGAVQDFTRGSAGSIRPMVDPRYTAPSSSSSPAAPRGSINSFSNGDEIPE